MKPERAIENLIRKTINRLILISDCADKEADRCAISRAIIALIKQIPQKVVNEKTSVGDYRCPNCNAAFIASAGTTQYCGNCGQALDWSDEK